MLRTFLARSEGLATLEYVIGAAVILGRLVTGVTAWNTGSSRGRRLWCRRSRR